MPRYRARSDNPLFIRTTNSFARDSTFLLTKWVDALDSIDSHGVSRWESVHLYLEFSDPITMESALEAYSALANTIVEERGNVLAITTENPGGTRGPMGQLCGGLVRVAEQFHDDIDSWAWDLGFEAEKT